MHGLIWVVLSYLNIWVVSIIHAASETYEYNAEIGRLMEIMINSLYTQKDVFLRELISNSNDAIERRRLVRQLPDLEGVIRIRYEDNKITVSDNGIGMNKEELKSNLGTVALSGTNEFVEALQNEEDKNLIGHFGVGFYSSFLVADQVDVESRRCNESEQNIWSSTMNNSFSIERQEKVTIEPCGTNVILHLNNETFADVEKLNSIATHYSQFVDNRIEVLQDGQWKHVNKTKAIWLREPNEVTDEEYLEFFISLKSGHDNYIKAMHIVSEEEPVFRAVLFIPVFNITPLGGDSIIEKQSNIQLYVKRVLVAQQFEHLIPQFLSFVIGVVDCSSLPLNISRQTLANHRSMQDLSLVITSHIFDQLDMFFKSSDDIVAEKFGIISDPETGISNVTKADLPKIHNIDYGDRIYRIYHSYLLYGCVTAVAALPKLVSIMRVLSTLSPFRLTNLEDYVREHKKPGEPLYYATVPSAEYANTWPLVKAYTSRNIPVLLLLHPLEEACIIKLSTLLSDGFVSVESGDPTSYDDPWIKDKLKEIEPRLKSFKTSIIETLEPLSVVDVKFASVIKSEPFLVYNMDGTSAHLEKIMNAANAIDSGRTGLASRKVSVNIFHPLVYKLYELYKTEDSNASSTCIFLFNLALLGGNFFIPDPANITNVTLKLLAENLKLPKRDEAEIAKMYSNIKEEL